MDKYKIKKYCNVIILRKNVWKKKWEFCISFLHIRMFLMDNGEFMTEWNGR